EAAERARRPGERPRPRALRILRRERDREAARETDLLERRRGGVQVRAEEDDRALGVEARRRLRLLARPSRVPGMRGRRVPRGPGLGSDRVEDSPDELARSAPPREGPDAPDDVVEGDERLGALGAPCYVLADLVTLGKGELVIEKSKKALDAMHDGRSNRNGC